MKFFTVIVTRDTTESTTLTIEAHDEAAAGFVALEAIRRDATGLVWDQDDNLPQPAYVTDVSEE